MANSSTDSTSKSGVGNSEIKSRVMNGEHQLERVAQGAGEKAGAMATDFAKSAAESVKTGKEYVKYNPFKGVAIAAAAGVVTGGLLAMALRNRKD